MGIATPKAWDDSMGEISGFGGGYEDMCRKMVLAGIQWFDEHPDAQPRFKGLQGVYGLVYADNDDAKAFEEAVMEACNRDCTGAMFHVTMQHCLAYKKFGWDEYKRQLQERGS